MVLQDVFIAIISAGRPEAVRHMVPYFAGLPNQPVWYVSLGDGSAYEAAGAQAVQEISGLCGARNRALDDAFAAGKVCIQISDDLSKVEQVLFGERNTTKTIPLQLALTTATARLLASPLKLAGVAPTHNPYFSRAPVVTNGFIVGDCLLVKPSEQRFDTRLRLKEDYDFTLQHWKAYGGALRCDDLLLTFAHRTNAGGAVAYRTPYTEADAINYLCKKWGRAIRINERRANEVLLNWRAVLQRAPVAVPKRGL